IKCGRTCIRVRCTPLRGFDPDIVPLSFLAVDSKFDTSPQGTSNTTHAGPRLNLCPRRPLGCVPTRHHPTPKRDGAQRFPLHPDPHADHLLRLLVVLPRIAHQPLLLASQHPHPRLLRCQSSRDQARHDRPGSPPGAVRSGIHDRHCPVCISASSGLVVVSDYQRNHRRSHNV
ncbi:hypothetical protein FIBSPDRAFT_1042882, partial [Athelia psychrophila]